MYELTCVCVYIHVYTLFIFSFTLTYDYIIFMKDWGMMRYCIRLQNVVDGNSLIIRLPLPFHLYTSLGLCLLTPFLVPCLVGRLNSSLETIVCVFRTDTLTPSSKSLLTFSLPPRRFFHICSTWHTGVCDSPLFLPSSEHTPVFSEQIPWLNVYSMYFSLFTLPEGPFSL